MGGDSDDDTQVSDAVAELAAEPTRLADAVDTLDSEAWSLCDEEPEARVRPWWITGAAVAASLAVVGAAAWIAVPHLRGGEPAPVPPSPVAAPVTTTTVAKAPLPSPPSPPPVTVTTVVVQSTVSAPQAPPPPPQAARIMSTWTYDVNWGGSPTLAVLELSAAGSVPVTIFGGQRIGSGTGWTGDLIGVDPIIDGPITWASCTLYVDGVVAKTDRAVAGDGHDVSCLVRLTR